MNSLQRNHRLQCADSPQPQEAGSFIGIRLSVMLGWVASLGGLQAGSLVYEPFAYPAGNLNGASGGAEVGLSGAWDAKVDGVRSAIVTDGSLGGAYASQGGSVGPLSPGTNRFGGARGVSGLNGSGLLNDGATLWMSVVMGYAPGGNQTNARLAVALGNDQFNAGNANYWINDDGAQLGSAVGITLGRINSTNGRAVATEFKDAASGDFILGNNLGSWTGNGVELASDQYAIYVVKFEWGATASDPETLTVYQPDSSLNLGQPISVLTGFSVDQTIYDTLSFARGDVVVLDEIRMGATSADVLPADATAPALSSVNPDQAQGVFPLQATFDEPVQLGTGDVRIYNSVGSVLQTTIAMSDTTQVALAGSVLTLSPTTLLVEGETYYVEMDQGVVRDIAGNNFAGLSGSAGWSFTVGPLTFPDGDPDSDGLTNTAEGNLGTNPLVADTDGDGLNDGDEVAAGTDPLVQDTDGDGYSDFDEIQAGSDPLLASSFPGDLDQDGLDDNWELSFFGNLNSDGSGDPDQDLLTNLLEFEAGLNPTLADTNADGIPDSQGLAGFLQVERWTGIPGDSLTDLFSTAAFYDQSNEIYFVRQAKTASDDGDDYGLMMTGRIVAPVTGAYRFWIAGNGECQLYLSDDQTRFRRRLIASVPVASQEEGWDENGIQESQEISLVAGQEYYLEVVLKEGSGPDHLAIAWEYPGQVREIIPASAIKTHVADQGDADGDGMLDTWEVAVGLDASDNGLTSLLQSPYLDLDGDGYLNFEEYLNGGNPLEVGGHSGSLELSVWSSVGGNQVRDFTSSTNFTTASDFTELSEAQVPNLENGNPGGRLRGTITAPETGYYVFDIAASYSGELWLSSDDSRFNKMKIAWNDRPSGYQEWKGDEARSNGVYLVAGQSYYLEALVKGGAHSNHLAVGWSRIPTSDWQTANVGTTTGSSWSEAAGVVSGATIGGNVGQYADEFTYRYLTVQGDCDISMRVASFNSNSNFEEVGLMIRQSLDPGSPHAYMIKRSNGTLVVNFRDQQDVRGRTVGGGDIGSPYQWVRIQRVGNQITGYQSMDGKTWGRRGRVTIPMTQQVYVGIAINGSGASTTTTATFDHFSFSDPSQIEVIPTTALTSISPDSADLDDDSLPDSWEVTEGLDATTQTNGNGEYGDPDGDGLTNFQEYLLGSDPLFAEGIPGYLSRQLWYTRGEKLADFVRSPESLEAPDVTDLWDSGEFIDFENHQYAQRLRGTLTAPVTGTYRFWMAGDRDYELWLSSTDSKFNKVRIAKALNDETGRTDAVDFRNWDYFATQISEPIELEAGQSYFIEMLHRDSLAIGHFSVAWSYQDATTGSTILREALPPAQLTSFLPDPDDLDDDYLPDSWEVHFGLNPADNGLIAVGLEGEYGDFDGDFLTNREEWLLGTDPTLADTDGDGLSDSEEVEFYRTNPVVSDATPEQVISTVDPTTVGDFGGRWVASDNGVTNTSFRGDGTWDFTVPSTGFWVLEVDGALLGNTGAEEVLPVHVKIDGKSLGLQEMIFRNGGQGSLRAFTHYLTAGTHSLSLYFDNYLGRRSIEVTGISVIQPGGLDLNQNGLSDMVEGQLEERNTIHDHATFTHVSPAFVEGIAPDPSLVDLTVITRSGEVNRRHRYIDSQWANMLPGFEDRLASFQPNLITQLRAGHGRMEGVATPHQPGPGTNTWYSYIDLARNEAIGYVALFEDLGYGERNTLVWTAYNVLQGGEMSIPVNSDLLLGAWIMDWDWKTVSLTVEGQTHSFPAGESYVHHFDQAGTYLISGSHPDGQTGTLTVHVEAADLPAGINLAEGRASQMTLPDIEPHLSIDSGGQFSVGPLVEADAGGSDVSLGGWFPGIYRTAARMPNGGPILDMEEVTVIGVSNALRNQADKAVGVSDGFIEIRSPLIVSHLPAGGYARITIFRAGVLFTDGTTVKNLGVNDFDEDGVAYLNFLFPKEEVGGFCHFVEVFDAQGNLIRDRD